jgi:hexosaminidase
VAAVVAFATARGIRVVPEADSPGHASSWAAGYPDVAIPQCSTLDPTKDETFALLDALFGEVGICRERSS